jgi:hypothetical protein
MPITSGNWGKALWPGINSWYGNAYAEHNVEHTDLFDTFSSRKAFEEDVGVTGFSLAPVKPQGSPIAYQQSQQGFVSRYNMVAYAMGFVMTHEAVLDDQYEVIGKGQSQSLAFSMRQTKETVGANVYNRAFNSSYTGGDGVELCSTAHLNVAGGTWANELTTAADLSEAALEQACIDIMKWTNDAGLKISAMATSLIIPPDLVFEADRILNSTLRYDTANNDKNAIKGKFPGGVKVNHYLTDSDAWFLRTNVPNGMKYFEREADRFEMDDDFDTMNAKYRAYGRYAFGWTDPRGIFGSPGA